VAARARLRPERHLGYAIQWFAFALVTAVLFIALNLRRAGADQEPGTP